MMSSSGSVKNYYDDYYDEHHYFVYALSFAHGDEQSVISMLH